MVNGEKKNILNHIIKFENNSQHLKKSWQSNKVGDSLEINYEGVSFVSFLKSKKNVLAKKAFWYAFVLHLKRWK